MTEYSRQFIVGKNKAGVIKLENHPENVYDEDIFLGEVSYEEVEYIWGNISYPALHEHGIFIDDRDYDEIPNELVDWFVNLIGGNKDKVPVFYKALMYAKESGGIIQVCF